MNARAVIVALAIACGSSRAYAQSPYNPPHVESATAHPLPTLNLATYNASEPARIAPYANVVAFGAKCDGVTNDNAAINAAAAFLASGGTVTFPAGRTCRSIGLITVSHDGVVIWGYGSVLFVDTNSSSTPSLAIKLVGAHTAVYGMTILSNLNTRRSNTDSTGIWLTADDQLAIDNRIEYTGTCIFAQGSTHYFIARNVCYRSWADGITSAGGGVSNAAPSYGIVVGNAVWQTGDEGISIVNYGGIAAPTLHEVYEAYNTVCDLYWSNGMSAHGGANITIEHNTICKIPFNSGIDIDSTTSFTERDLSNVLVRNNALADIQTLAPSYNPIPGVHTNIPHGALYMNIVAGHSAANVMFTANSISRATQRAVQVQVAGAATGLGFSVNRWAGVTGGDVTIAAAVAANAWCSDLQVIDGGHVSPSNCTGSAPTVTGSSYTTR